MVKFYLIAVLSIVFGLKLANAQVLPAPEKLDQAKNIQHMIGIYVNEKSLNFVEHNLDQLLEINGYSSTDYYHQNFSKKMEITPFNDLFPDNQKIQRAGKTVRDNFRRFLKGLTIKNRHEFEFEANGIEISAEWEKFGVKIAPSNIEDFNSRGSILVEAHLKPRRLRFYVKEFRARDLQHSFLGDIGANGFYFEVAPTQAHNNNLSIVVPARIRALPNGGIHVEVLPIRHNLREIALRSGWNPPLLLPRVEIRINGRRAFLKLDEIERIIAGEMPGVLNGLSEMAQNFLNEKAPQLLNEKANAFFNKSFREVNLMDPVGIPTGKIDQQYVWGLSLGELNFVGRNLHAGLKGFVLDPKYDRDLDIPQNLLARAAPLAQTFAGEEYDLALSLNQGFINRILQYSNRRGYFKKLEVSGGQTLNLVEMPRLNFINKGGASNKPATLSIKTKYTLEGWKKIFIRNPLQISMDMEIVFTKNDRGQTQMVIAGIDLDSVNLPDRYIRVFKKTVRKNVRKMLADISRSVKGTVLSENLPLPTDIAGVGLTTLKTKIDPNGHLIIFMNVEI